ncbi:MAG: TIR domain-containing protein [Candidatus Acidiferrales bacterium]
MMEDEETAPLVFISYSSEDANRASDVRDELQSNHYRSFLAHDDIEAAEDWHEQIWNNLQRAKGFVGLVTADFNHSAFCQQEIGAALALNKPSILLFCDAHRKVPGFAGRFQAVKRAKLLASLNELPKFRPLRVEAWIRASREARAFQEANDIYKRFHDEWGTMTDDEKLRWILAGASNTQIRNEGYLVGPFYKNAYREMKSLFTNQWLFENDKDGFLHDIDSNPFARKNRKK